MMLPGFVPGLPAAVGSIPQRVGDEGVLRGSGHPPQGHRASSKPMDRRRAVIPRREVASDPLPPSGASRGRCRQSPALLPKVRKTRISGNWTPGTRPAIGGGHPASAGMAPLCLQQGDRPSAKTISLEVEIRSFSPFRTAPLPQVPPPLPRVPCGPPSTPAPTATAPCQVRTPSPPSARGRVGRLAR